MLTSLRLKGYRGFRDYGVAGLARVNLLGGRNNCGKTSILEAVHLLESGADPEVLMQIAERRGEVLAATPTRHGYRVDTTPTPTCAHFFYGHDFAKSHDFGISGDGEGGRRSTTVVVLREIDLAGEQQAGKPMGAGSAGPSLQVFNKPETPSANFYIPVTEEGAMLKTRTTPPGRRGPVGSKKGPPVVFVAPDSLILQSMSDMWNEVVKERREREVIDAMRILEPDLEDISELVAADDPLIDHATTATATAKQLGAKFSKPDTKKATLHTWLAWQKEPGKPYGTAIRARYFRVDSPAAQQFVAWFKRLFTIR